MNHRNRKGIRFLLELLEFGVLGITQVFPVRVQPGFNPYNLGSNSPQDRNILHRIIDFYENSINYFQFYKVLKM